MKIKESIAKHKKAIIIGGSVAVIAIVGGCLLLHLKKKGIKLAFITADKGVGNMIVKSVPAPKFSDGVNVVECWEQVKTGSYIVDVDEGGHVLIADITGGSLEEFAKTVLEKMLNGDPSKKVRIILGH